MRNTYQIKDYSKYNECRNFIPEIKKFTHMGQHFWEGHIVEHAEFEIYTTENDLFKAIDKEGMLMSNYVPGYVQLYCKDWSQEEVSKGAQLTVDPTQLVDHS